MATAHGLFARALYRLGKARLFRFFSRREEAAPRSLPAAELKWLSEKDLYALCGDAVWDLTPQKIDAASARGDRCAGASLAGRLAGYCWFSNAALPHLDGVWVAYDARVLWIYKSFVLPAHRGRGVAPALYGLADELARSRGCGASLICVETHNAPSVTAARHAGYRSAGFAAYRRGNGDSLRAWYSPAVREYGVRFYLP